MPSSLSGPLSPFPHQDRICRTTQPPAILSPCSSSAGYGGTCAKAGRNCRLKQRNRLLSRVLSLLQILSSPTSIFPPCHVASGSAEKGYLVLDLGKAWSHSPGRSPQNEPRCHGLSPTRQQLGMAVSLVQSSIHSYRAHRAQFRIQVTRGKEAFCTYWGTRIVISAALRPLHAQQDTEAGSRESRILSPIHLTMVVLWLPASS